MEVIRRYKKVREGYQLNLTEYEIEHILESLDGYYKQLSDRASQTILWSPEYGKARALKTISDTIKLAMNKED